MVKKRLEYLDYLRVVAACAVVVLHVSSKFYYAVDNTSLRWIAFAFYDAIVRWGVPVFVMISGSLFLNKDKSIKEIYKKNILRIVIAFIIWSLIYAIFNYCTSDISIKKAAILFLNGPGHLWYLKMIVVIYAIVPFLKKIVENEKIMQYFLCVTFLLSFVVPQVLRTIISQFDRFHSVLDFYLRSMNLNFILCYACYFVLGYYLNNTKLSKKTTRIIYVLGIIGFIGTIVATVLSPYSTNRIAIFLENSNVSVLLEAMFIFLLVKNFVTKHEINEKINSFIMKLSKYSFGQYLVHIIVLNVLSMYGFNSLSFNSFISIPIVALVVIIISIIISAILNKIPIVKKYMV